MAEDEFIFPFCAGPVLFLRELRIRKSHRSHLSALSGLPRRGAGTGRSRCARGVDAGVSLESEGRTHTLWDGLRSRVLCRRLCFAEPMVGGRFRRLNREHRHSARTWIAVVDPDLHLACPFRRG